MTSIFMTQWPYTAKGREPHCTFADSRSLFLFVLLHCPVFAEAKGGFQLVGFPKYALCAHTVHSSAIPLSFIGGNCIMIHCVCMHKHTCPLQPSDVFKNLSHSASTHPAKGLRGN